VQIRIATLNVWGLPAPFTPDGAQRMGAIGRRLGDLGVDVMAFQEVWTADVRDILVRAGRAAGLDEYWHTEASLGGSGLLVLSRLPIHDVQFDRFRLRGQPERITQGDYYGGKGFARIRLSTPAGPVTIVNTHLHARYGGNVAHEYRGLRATQVVELAARIRETSDPIIAAGDFNFQEDQVGYTVLTGLTGFRDSAAEVANRQPTVFYGNAYRTNRRKPDRRIDYVFVRNGRDLGVDTHKSMRVFDETIEIDGQPAAYSNHAGVMAEFSIVPRAAVVPPPDPRAIELATQLIAEGRREAQRRQRSNRALAGAGVGGAALALCGLRSKPMTRRKLLRNALQAAGLAAITPGVAYSILSEYFVPDELAGFEAVAQQLSRFDAESSALLA